VSTVERSSVVIVGAGLVGCLLAAYLSRRGYRVEIYERQGDLRQLPDGGGRSINLTLTERGFTALEEVGIGGSVRESCVPLYGRLMHGPDGEETYQPYGNHGEAIFSIRRNDLNRILLDFAEAQTGVSLHFGWACVGVDAGTPSVQLRNRESGEARIEDALHVFGADGSFSTVRRSFMFHSQVNYSQTFFDQGYKELSVPPREGGAWGLQPNATHIWPRGRHMLIGFPNSDCSVTLALHLPFEGPASFEALGTEDSLLELFRKDFPDVLPKLPNLVDEFFSRPTNSMVTIRCSPWTFHGKVSLIGDAAHAIYPSYGQGANSGFEDCQILDSCLERGEGSWPRVMKDFETLRKPSTDAIADLAEEHFEELRAHVADPKFLLRKKVERYVSKKFPVQYMDLYSMVSFTSIPYVETLHRERRQRSLIDRLVSMSGIEDRLGDREFDEFIANALHSDSVGTLVSDLGGISHGQR